jgi:hypothetical protein
MARFLFEGHSAADTLLDLYQAVCRYTKACSRCHTLVSEHVALSSIVHCMAVKLKMHFLSSSNLIRFN